MFKWTQESIAYMDDACRRTDFHRKLAAELQPYLRETDSVCDAGCGLGYLSLSLAPYVGAVTAVERDSQALAVLERELALRHIENVHPCCEDVFAHRPEKPYDAMVFCFFGSMDEILSVARSRCRGTVIAVKRDHRDHRFTVTKQSLEESHGVAAAEARLTELNIPYELKRTAYRFDQPFRNWEEARLFFETYRRRDDASLITDGFLREKLEPTGDAAFPWHIPVVRRAGIFVFQTSKIPEKLPHEANQEGKRK